MKQQLYVGDRVELHPGCDLWMRGARFGDVIALTSRGVRVKLDKIPKPVTFPNDLLTIIVHRRDLPAAFFSNR